MNVPENQNNGILYVTASWSTDISSFYYSNINLFLIDYGCFKLCNIWLLLFENNCRSNHYTGASYCWKNVVSVITQDRVIDENLKRQIKNQPLYTCRLFLLTRKPKFFNIWAIAQNYLSIYPLSFFSIHRVITFPKFSRSTIFKLIIYYSWHTSNFGTTYKKPPFIKVAIFFWCSFSIKLSWLRMRNNKINTILCDRYYLQNCKAITFEKIANHSKDKKPNVPSHLHIFWLNFDKAIIFSPPFFAVGGNRFSKKYCLGKRVISFCLGRDDEN